MPRAGMLSLMPFDSGVVIVVYAVEVARVA